jgi:hypothetical protein
MENEEDPRTHAQRILAMEEIQWLSAALWLATGKECAAVRAAYVRISDLVEEITDFLHADASFMGVSDERLQDELRLRRSSSPVASLVAGFSRSVSGRRE